MKYIKSSELVSFGVLIAIFGSIMGWYASRIPVPSVPVQKPAHVSQQYFM
jgi:hypothetical protein